MNIQIFGTKKCNDTKKAERFFKERRIKFSILKSTYGTEYFHGLYLYSFYLCIKKTKGEKKCINIIH